MSSQLGAVAVLASAAISGILSTAAANERIHGPLKPVPSEQGSLQKADTISPDPLVKELERLQEAVRTKGIPVSLEQTIAIGLERNPDLSKAFAELQTQEWRLIAEQRKWYPQISINSPRFLRYGWNTRIHNEYGNAARFNSQRNQQKSRADSRSERLLNRSTSGQHFAISPNIDLSWKFIDPSRQASINSQSASLEQQKYFFLTTARTVVVDLQKAYFSIQRSAQLIDSFQKLYDINRRQLEIMEAQKEIGMLTVLDVEQTRAQLFVNLSQLILYTKNYIAETATLAELMALSPDTLAIPNQPAAPHGAWNKPLEDTISEAVTQREEILAALQEAESYQWSGVSELRKYLPVFSLVGRGSLEGVNGYKGIPVNMDAGSAYATTRSWDTSVGVGFTWSVFDGGINAANAESSFANSRRSLASKALKENEVIKQVRASYGQMLTAKIAIESSRQGYQSAQLAEEAARERFEVGVGDITSVVQAIGLISRTSQQLAESIWNYNNAVADLYRFTSTWPKDTKGKLDERLLLMREEAVQ